MKSVKQKPTGDLTFKFAPLALAMGLFISGCGGGSTSTPEIIQPEPPVSLTEQYAEAVYADEDTEVTSGSYMSPAAVQYTDRLIIRYKAIPSIKAMTASTSKTTLLAGEIGMKLTHVRETADGSEVMQLDTLVPVGAAAIYSDILKVIDPNIESVEPDVILQPSYIPNDLMYSQQRYLHDIAGGINAPIAWDSARGTGINVAVIDTGVTQHSDLIGNVLPGYDMISSAVIAGDGDGRDANAYDNGDSTVANQCGTNTPARNSSWHGTHVAGIVAATANNAKGVSGVAPSAKIIPVRALGKCGGYMSDISDAITWAAGGSVPGIPVNANPAKVINLSLGGTSTCSSITQSAINFARSKNAVVLVAAGNGNTLASTQTPANCQGVITVGSVGLTGKKASYSNYGPTVTVSAPGGDTDGGILSTLNAGTTTPAAENYAFYMGTSMATPVTSGVVALMLSAKNTLTPDQITDILKKTTKPFPIACSQGCGAGIVNAKQAVDATKSTVVAPPPPPTPAPVTSATYTEAEPNDTIKTAQFLNAVSSTVNASIATSADADFYKVVLPNKLKLTTTMTPADAKSGFSLGFYTEGGARIIELPGVVGVKPTIAVTNLTGVSVNIYVKVTRTTGTVGKYTLTSSYK